MDKFNAWITANHLEIIWGGLVMYLIPALLGAIVKPAPGSRAAAFFDVCSSWGFDAAKFREKLLELIRTKGVPPRGIARLHTLGFVACLGVATAMGLGCAGWKRDAKSVVDAATAVCVIANGMSTNAEIMAICGIEQALAPVVDAILSEHRAQLKASALRVCK